MELIKINDRKLKVMLSEVDLKLYDLDCDKIDYDCSATKAAFRAILSEARERVGFDTASDKIFVQIYPARCGGCEMFVTKLTERTEASVHSLSAVYYFEALEALIGACARLQEYGFKDRSAAYAGERGYYLLISEDYKQNNNTYSVNERGKSVPHYPLLGEYGRRLRADRTIPRVSEHCSLICAEDAVRRLAELN